MKLRSGLSRRYLSYLRINPARMMNLFFTYLSLKRLPDRVWHKPISLELESANNCNYGCVMCPRTYVEKNYAQTQKQGHNMMNIGVLKLENYFKIIEQFPYVENLALHGMGEPLLNKDLDKMIKDSKDRGIRKVWIITNGSLLNEDWSRRLLTAGIDSIGISFEGINENYSKMRVGGDFDKVVGNLKRFLELKKEMKANTNVSINVTFVRDNKGDYKDLLKMFHEIGVDTISGGNIDFGFTQKVVSGINPMTDSDLLEIRDYAKATGIPFDYDPDKAYDCFYPWLKPYITWDGFITPCCLRPFPNQFNFGNVLDKPFSEIWNGSIYQKFRNDFKNGRPPITCQNCTSYEVDVKLGIVKKPEKPLAVPKSSTS